MCPACGYCAPHIDETFDDLRAVIDRDEYREQFDDHDVPELARAFLCAAFVLEDVGRDASAAWNTIRAAWACDDVGAGEAARRCRQRALEHAWTSAGDGDELLEDLASEGVLLADLLRRAGRFDEAREEATDRLEYADDPLVHALLTWEIELAERCDDAAHSVAEIAEQ